MNIILLKHPVLEQCRCSKWVNFADYTEIKCTWRLASLIQSATKYNSHALGVQKLFISITSWMGDAPFVLLHRWASSEEAAQRSAAAAAAATWSTVE